MRDRLLGFKMNCSQNKAVLATGRRVSLRMRSSLPIGSQIASRVHYTYEGTTDVWTLSASK